MIKKLLFVFMALFILLALLIFRPVPIVKEEKALSVTGKVSRIYEAGIHDIVFILEDHPVRYYINRGMEHGLVIDTLEQQLIGREILIKYPKYWTPLDWDGRVKHLSKLEFNGEVIFNELK